VSSMCNAFALLQHGNAFVIDSFIVKSRRATECRLNKREDCVLYEDSIAIGYGLKIHGEEIESERNVFFSTDDVVSVQYSLVYCEKMIAVGFSLLGSTVDLHVNL
jgi:hypothetical protein